MIKFHHHVNFIGVEMLMKVNILVFGSLIIASILGIYGQGIAYFLNENIAKIHPIYYLTVITITSVFLYGVTVLLMYIYTKKQIIKKDKFSIYLYVIGFIGVPISLWSIFVLAMWWG